ncbi:hypothetical protein Unana1_08726 [Umbelopsis nana]
MAITVGIAGITSKFACLLTSHLLKHSDVVVRGYCRNASKVPVDISSSPNVQIVEGEAFDKDQIRSFVAVLDVVICCYLGEDKLMVDGQKALIDACEEANLEFGQLFPKDPMKHVKAYLETKKNVKGVHILVGAFMDPMFSPFFSVLDPQTNTLRFWGEDDEVWEGTSYDKAAEYNAAIALDNDVLGIQRVTGGRTTNRGLAESFEKVYGIKPHLEKLGSLDDLFKRMHEIRAQQPKDFFNYMSLFHMYYWINGQTNVGPETDNSKYPEI